MIFRDPFEACWINFFELTSFRFYRRFKNYDCQRRHRSITTVERSNAVSRLYRLLAQVWRGKDRWRSEVPSVGGHWRQSWTERGLPFPLTPHLNAVYRPKRFVVFNLIPSLKHQIFIWLSAPVLVIELLISPKLVRSKQWLRRRRQRRSRSRRSMKW